MVYIKKTYTFNHFYYNNNDIWSYQVLTTAPRNSTYEFNAILFPFSEEKIAPVSNFRPEKTHTDMNDASTSGVTLEPHRSRNGEILR